MAGTFRDASAYDWLTLVVDWGDQTAPRRFHFPPGTTQFRQEYVYVDDGTYPATARRKMTSL